MPSMTGGTRDSGWIPGLGRSPGVGNGNPFQYSCLENSMRGGGWWATVLEIAESDTSEHSTAATVCAIPDFSTFQLYLLATYILQIIGKL